ncbi:hypothetical protein [Sulfurospirillum arcachonense]|uniref:hypothetical protein n=1 Tax=Sulfurospirillum arcachonense TaxID=57666 RepID=UPI00046A4910|nr:hypothetical protein [Sulfurospirillum arcachonense]
MNINKDAIICILILIILVLLGFVFFQEPVIKTVTKVKIKPLVKTITSERIIYRDKEYQKNKVAKPKEISTTEKEIQKEYIISSTKDNRHKYTISLFSLVEPTQTKDFKKIVLTGNLIDDTYKSRFILNVNQILLDEVGDTYFKITDNNTKEVYATQNPCLYNLLEYYIYKVNLELSGNSIICDIEEDKELEEKDRKIYIKKKIENNLENNNLKNNFLNPILNKKID